MSASILHRLHDHCAYSPIRTSDVRTRLLDGMVLVYVDVLDQLIAGQNQTFKDAVEKSWIRIQAPPEEFTHLEMFYLLLSSHGYTMNPTNFYWEKATNDTYISLWKLLTRFSIQFKDTIPIIRENMRDRSADGFSNSRGISVANAPLNQMITTSMPGLQGYLNSVSKWSQVECPFMARLGDLHDTGDEYEKDPDAESSSEDDSSTHSQRKADIERREESDTEDQLQEDSEDSESSYDDVVSDSDRSYSSYEEITKVIARSRNKRVRGPVTLLSGPRMQSSFESRRLAFSLH